MSLPRPEPPEAQTPLAGLRLLIVDDDPAVRLSLAELLAHRGVTVLQAESCAVGLRSAIRNVPDLAILDYQLGDGTGDALCRDMRRRGFSKPIVILSAFGDPKVQTSGLDCGADEFWTKPIPAALLEARLRAILRRVGRGSEIPARIRIGNLVVDLRRREALRDGTPVTLSRKEYGILEALWHAHGSPVSRADLLARVWKFDYLPNTRTIDNYVVKLRKHLEADPRQPAFLLTLPGFGYQLQGAQPEPPDNPAATHAPAPAQGPEFTDPGS